jgi:hypothetical protein
VDANFVGGQGSVSAEASAEAVIDSVHEKTEKSNMDSSCMKINCTNEPASDYDWNLEPLADCSCPCPAFGDSSDDDIL